VCLVALQEILLDVICICSASREPSATGPGVRCAKLFFDNGVLFGSTCQFECEKRYHEMTNCTETEPWKKEWQNTWKEENIATALENTAEWK
jgi:hypothetical protein